MKDISKQIELELKREELFAKFLAQTKAFIVDTSPASRARLMKTLVDMGAKPHLIQTFCNYEEAEARIGEMPQIVITEYRLRDKSGFDLLQTFRKYKGNERSLFILITANSSQSLVAQAAEEDIDAYILKPYTQESLKSSLMMAAMAKFFPSDYALKIDEGKKLLFGGKPAEAKVSFEEAMKLHEKTALACFYYGQAELMENALGKAEEMYTEGLSHNKIHYKCLTHLFDLLFNLNRHDEAYEVVKQIATYFPANPKRLSTVLRLAIMTDNFKDIESYYELFTSIENRTDELVRYICAAMITCGRYYLIHNYPDRALKLFEKVKTTAAGREKYRLYVIQHLVEFSLDEEAPAYLERFTGDNYRTREYKIAEFLVKTKTLAAAEVVNRAKKLIAEKHISYCVYYVYLRALLVQKKTSEANTILEEATFLYPDKEHVFRKLVQIKEAQLEGTA